MIDKKLHRPEMRCQLYLMGIGIEAESYMWKLNLKRLVGGNNL